MKLSSINLSLRGYSRSAEATYFFIPELKISLDMGGIDKSTHSNSYFITHTHMDHCVHMPEAQPAFVNLTDPTLIFVPIESVPFVQNYMHSAQELNAVQVVDREANMKAKPFTLHGVSPGQNYPILNNRYEVDIIKCHHSVPTVGYAFSEPRSKLKEEYKSLKKTEIAELKKKGTEITEKVKGEKLVFSR